MEGKPRSIDVQYDIETSSVIYQYDIISITLLALQSRFGDN